MHGDTCWIKSLIPVIHTTFPVSTSKDLQQCGDDPTSASRDIADKPFLCLENVALS